MDTLKIKAVLLAVKYKSLSKAAEEFSYTPSALSHSVDSLENELGVKLLNRSHTGVELSEEGELLLEKLSAVVDAENELIKCASAISASKHNRLRIGTYSSVSVNLLPKILNGFKERHSEISISITVGNKISDWLDKDIVDVLFGIENADYEWLPIIRDDFVAVVPKMLFPDRKKIRCEELYPYPFILTGNLLDVTRNFELNSFKELISLTSEDDMSAVSMVQEGMGVTVLPSLVLKKQQKGIRTIKLEPSLYRTLGVSYKKELHTSSGAMKFVQYLKSLY
ncbi:MAG: LysR family transcriptional regulator [Clostridia bacterium]|nr:LysR family transcriptional regulator [Clostridia bacterium]